MEKPLGNLKLWFILLNQLNKSLFTFCPGMVACIEELNKLVNEEDSEELIELENELIYNNLNNIN